MFGLDVLAVPLELRDVSGFSVDEMALGLMVPWLSVCAGAIVFEDYCCFSCFLVFYEESVPVPIPCVCFS